ncbi:MAG TPA: hypothetical protein VNG35_12330, partial [Gemmatimonadales bacterium]|nr:hypothetical protein [Gemmatimonadales bacterium]
ALVSACAAPRHFELEITRAGADWVGTRVGFDITGQGTTSQVRFSHTGWPQSNEHYRVSCYCWPMYLRILRRYLEHGETVPYEQRLDV